MTQYFEFPQKKFRNPVRTLKERIRELLANVAGSFSSEASLEGTLTCPCGFEGHADLTASETFLRENSDTEVRPMARPVRFEWDDHEWSGKPHPHESPKEVRTNPQVASVVVRDGLPSRDDERASLSRTKSA